MKVASLYVHIACGAGLAAAIGLLAPSALRRSEAAPADDGPAIYAAKCAQCHGAAGKGDGPASALLTPRPTDFTAASYKFRSTASGSLPTDEDLARTIREGLPGTAMPAWKDLLPEPALRAVVGYIKSFSPRFKTEPPTPIAVGPDVPSSAASVAAGRLVFDRLGCATCHGRDGNDASATSLTDAAGRATVATSLAEPWTFRGGATARDVSLRLRTGLNGTPMPSFADTASDEELWHLAHYVVSLARKPTWEMSSAELAEHDARMAARAAAHPVERGRYLAATLRCVLCHTPMREDGSLDESMLFAGGQRRHWDTLGDYVSKNLTPDEATGIGGWTDDQIKAAITRGERPDGSRLRLFAMPWPTFSRLTPEDLSAIVAYLRTVPPISNVIPPPRRPNIAVYLRSKLMTLVLHRDLPQYIYSGNAGGVRK